ncbi:MAG TPA: Gfo/Idh/MocA family oxidoreductase [Verrucomicrobiae bacterium]
MKNNHSRVRYAVVGLGHIAQEAVLPAFAAAKENSEVTALVSDDPEKLRKLGRHLGVTNVCDYEGYDNLLASGQIDAVYIALPNSLHRDYVLRAAKAKIHVLCEKPLGTSEAECRKMIDACAKANVRLMTAYRLHFERANMEAVEIVQSGKLGEPRFFQSLFSMQTEPGNIRLKRDLGGGPLYDIGIYCINAARYIFRAEPLEVFAFSASNDDKRFTEVDEMSSVMMRFPDDCLASFTCSFGATDTDVYTVVGTEGTLKVSKAYEYAEPISLEVTTPKRSMRKTFPKRDQFAAELVYFSDCVLNHREPEPSGEEGLRDVRIIEAILRSADRNKPIRLKTSTAKKRPDRLQVIERRKTGKKKLVKAKSPAR